MPIYEYRCPDGHTFELFQRMTDPPPADCQICGARPVSKVLYPAAIHFKGSGFYSTDYGRGRRRDSSRDGDAPGGESGEKQAEKPQKQDKPKPKAAAADG
jgi:putative FmdB family regulatory protein